MTIASVRRRRLTPIAVGVVMLALGALPTVAVSAFDPPFAPSSPFNRLVPTSPTLASNGAGVGSVRRSVNYGEYTPAVYISSSSQPLYTLRLKNQGSWGNNPVNGKSVRLPATARPSVDSDGHLTIVVPSEGIAISLFQAETGPRPDGTWWATWAGMASLSGPGSNRPDSNGGRESGISQLAGLIHPDDVRRAIAMGPNGDLGHALSVGYNMIHTTKFVSPAIKAGGASTSSQGLYMGQKIFLDPKLNLDPLPWQGTAANQRFGKLIARTLQRYGAIVVTNSGALTFQLWHPNSFTKIGQPDPWPALIGPGYGPWYGFTTKAIPASAFRVLAPDQPTPAPTPSTQRSVSIIGPTAGAILAGSVRWEARPTGFSATRVEFLVDGVRKWTEHLAPYVFGGDSSRWDTRSVANGAHTLLARAVASDGATITRSVGVTVRN